VCKDKISPKSELIIYIGIASEGYENIFMHSSGNVVFTAAHAEFIENLFPHCTMRNRQQQRLPDSNNQIPSPRNSSELEDNDLINCLFLYPL